MTCRVLALSGGQEMDPENWWGAVDAEIMGCLAECDSMSVAELCERTGVSQGEMMAFLAMLVHEGRVRIRQVERAA